MRGERATISFGVSSDRSRMWRVFLYFKYNIVFVTVHGGGQTVEAWHMYLGCVEMIHLALME